MMIMLNDFFCSKDCVVTPRISFCSIIIALLLSTGASHGQEADALTKAKDRESLVRATRMRNKLDKNKNGTFEKSENPKAWKRLQKLDANNDEVLTVEELQQERKQEAAVGLKSEGDQKLNIVYKKTSVGDQRLDLYYPATKTTSPYPVIIYTHGGGWAAGNKQGVTKTLFSQLFLRLLDEGFAVASVDYRLCKPHRSVKMRDCVIDSKDAIRYLAKNSKTLNLNPQRFFVFGDSAGGQIAQMLLLTPPETLPGDSSLADASYKIVAGVSWYGPCDFEKTQLFNHDDRADFKDRFGPRITGRDTDLNAEEKLALFREMSPVNYVNKDCPPLLMIQGDKDTTIPVKHAYYMQQKAESVDAPVEIMIIENSGHNWRKVRADISPSKEEIDDRTVKFFVDHQSPK